MAEPTPELTPELNHAIGQFAPALAELIITSTSVEQKLERIADHVEQYVLNRGNESYVRLRLAEMQMFQREYNEILQYSEEDYLENPDLLFRGASAFNQLQHWKKLHEVFLADLGQAVREALGQQGS